MVTTVVTNAWALRAAASRLPSTFVCWLTRYSPTLTHASGKWRDSELFSFEMRHTRQ